MYFSFKTHEVYFLFLSFKIVACLERVIKGFLSTTVRGVFAGEPWPTGLLISFRFFPLIGAATAADNDGFSPTRLALRTGRSTDRAGVVRVRVPFAAADSPGAGLPRNFGVDGSMVVRPFVAHFV